MNTMTRWTLDAALALEKHAEEARRAKKEREDAEDAAAYAALEADAEAYLASSEAHTEKIVQKTLERIWAHEAVIDYERTTGPAEHYPSGYPLGWYPLRLYPQPPKLTRATNF
jgi:hypothetical protein